MKRLVLITGLMLSFMLGLEICSNTERISICKKEYGNIK